MDSSCMRCEPGDCVRQLPSTQKNMQKVQRELAEGKPDLLRAGGWLSVESMTLLMLHLTTP